MITNLIPLINKPNLNDFTTNSLYRTLWEDEHISKGMLESHLGKR